MSCSDSQTSLFANNVVNLTVGSTDYFFGSELNNGAKYPCIARFDSGKQTWCSCSYESVSATAGAYGGLFDYDYNTLYVVFQTASPSDNFSKYTTNGWITALGNNVDSEEVAVLLEIDISNGTPTGSGTYVHAIDNQGIANYTHLTYWQKQNTDSMTLTFEAGTFPLNTDLTPQSCSAVSGYYNWNVEFSLDLSTVQSSSANNCVSKNTQGGGGGATKTHTPSRSRSKNPHSTKNTSRSHSPSKNHGSSASTLAISVFVFAVSVLLFV